MLIGDRHLPGPITPWTTADDTDHDVYPSSTLTASDYGPITLRTSADDTDPDVYHSSPLTASDYGPYYLREAFAALQRYLPSNEPDFDSVLELPSLGSESPVDAYSCDHFRMYEFKVRSCARGRSHDWTECPYAHPGEKARRRDPRRFHYSGSPCPDFRKGSCRRGDGCEFAHGVFECWLHPDRYRTQPCKDGTNCRRRVCFFAHTAEQLRVLSPRSVASIDSYDGSPLRQARSISSPADSPAVSPPMSPVTRPVRSNTVNEIVASLRNLQLNKVKSLPPSWSGSGHGSPRGSILRPCFSSLPSTPTAPTRSIFGWDNLCVEEPAMERVESGRGLRAKMFEKLSKENSLVRADPNRYEKFSGDNDIGWVSELFK